ncbi:MAG: VOC family protein [Gemmatimonadaceae bacterium]|nr:VOC family protein [Gemmatimonadaceae bacterium]
MATPDEHPLRLLSAVPQFTVPDVVQTAEYYRDTLGFRVADYWATPPQFAIVWRDAVEIFFNKATGGPMRSGRARGAYDAYIRVTDAETLAADLRTRGADIIEGPTRRVYDSIEVVVRDCNGLILAFGQDVSPPAA